MVNKKPYEQIKFSVKPYQQQYKDWTRSPSTASVLKGDETTSSMSHYPLDESNASISGNYINSNIDGSLNEKCTSPDMIVKPDKTKIGDSDTNNGISSGRSIYDNKTSSSNSETTDLAVNGAILVATHQSKNTNRSDIIDEPRNVKKQKVADKNAAKSVSKNQSTHDEFLLMDRNSFASEDASNKGNTASNINSSSAFKVMSGSINVNENSQTNMNPLYHILQLKEINSQVAGPHSLIARNSVKIWIQNRLQHLGIHLAIERSDDKKVVLRCRNKNHDNASTKLAKGIKSDNLTHSNNCMFKIRANFSKKQQKWNISIINDKHNHYLVSDLRLFPGEDPYYSNLYLQNNNGVFIDEMNSNSFEDTVPKIPENHRNENDKKPQGNTSHTKNEYANAGGRKDSNQLNTPGNSDGNNGKINKNQDNSIAYKNTIYNDNNDIQEEPNFNFSYNFPVDSDTRNSNIFPSEISNNIINEYPKYEKTNTNIDYSKHLIDSQENNKSNNSLNANTKAISQYHCRINMDNKSLPLYVSVNGNMLPLYRNSNGYFIKK